MTEQQRLTIRAELARRMGWKLAHHGYGLSPDYPAVPQPRALPDPFTDAAAMRELVKWLAKNEEAAIEKFHRELQEIVEPSPICILIAPLSVITLAAARALGIETE